MKLPPVGYKKTEYLLNKLSPWFIGEHVLSSFSRYSSYAKRKKRATLYTLYINFFHMNILWILGGVAAFAVVYFITTYNGFVSLRNRVKEAWADIDVQLKRRHDLIPNLMEAVKGYMAHERGVLEHVTEARSKAMQAGSTHDKQEAENMLTGALKSLFAVSENYPDLKASQNFLE